MLAQLIAYITAKEACAAKDCGYSAIETRSSTSTFAHLREGWFLNRANVRTVGGMLNDVHCSSSRSKLRLWKFERKMQKDPNSSEN